jgi:hypothetical protein
MALSEKENRELFCLKDNSASHDTVKGVLGPFTGESGAESESRLPRTETSSAISLPGVTL